MNGTFGWFWRIMIGAAFTAGGLIGTYEATRRAVEHAIPVRPVQDPGAAERLRAASVDVAMVFGRADGCASAGLPLVTLVASEALGAGVPPRVLAATLATESKCDRLAVSRAGALGYMQVVARTWDQDFDFGNKYNLLNERDNVHVGATILARLIKDHGLNEGLHRYNGTGTGCPNCDGQYVQKILRLSGGGK